MTNRILCIVQRYYPAKGGAELFIKILCEYLANSGICEVDVWTTNAFSPERLWDLEGEIIEKKEERIENVNVRRFEIGSGILKNKYLNKIYRILLNSSTFFSISNLATCPTTFGMLSEIKNIKRYDAVVVSTTPYYFLFYVGYLISKKFNIPFVVIPALHTGVEANDALKRKYLRKTAIPFFTHASNIILNTETEGKAIQEFCKDNGKEIENKKLTVIGQGVFFNKIRGGNGNKFRNKYRIKNDIVFQVGSKSYEKGSISLVNAMIRCWDNGANATLVFAGGYNNAFSIFLDSLERGYRDKILNIDNPSDQEIWDLCDAGSIFSMVSKTDSFGIVYLEAWAYGKPVLACDNEVMREIISNGEDGYLIEFDNIKDISDKILILLNDNEKRNKMGQSGKEKVEQRYDWNKNLVKIGRLFKKLLQI